MGFLSKLFSHKSVEEVADEIANTYAEEVQAVTAEQTDTAGAETEQVNIDGRIERTQENLAKLRLDHAEAQKIVAEPFPQQEELDSKEERLKTVTDELNQAAIEAKKNAPKRERTCYFERAKMKRDAARLAKKPKPQKDKAKGRSKQGIE